MTAEKFCSICERPRDNSLIFRELLEMEGKKAKCYCRRTADLSKQIPREESQMDGKHVKSQSTLFLLIKDM